MARNGLPKPGRLTERAFTVVELLVVMAIILVLAGLVLGTSGYVHNKGARSRAEAEIAAMSAALENYKADNGSYPDYPSLDARSAVDLNAYQAASLQLYKSLTGDTDGDGQPGPGTPSYFSFKDNQLSQATGSVQFIKDPFGNSYGYSTAYAADATKGYNPTFDLWSTGGVTTGTDQSRWLKNW
jgi:prepilin-type N-terminal cleavage/methylation domain-containing protein